MRSLLRFALVSSALVLLAASGTPVATKFTPFALPAKTTIMDPAFTRDARTLYLTKSVNRDTETIVAMTREGNGWSTPVPVSFSGRWRDLEEVLSPDGTTMVFSSNRPVKAGSAALDATYYHKFARGFGGNLWIVHRNATGWGTPTHLPDAINSNTSVFSPTIAADGTLYFMRASGPRAAFHLFVSHLDNGVYRTSTLAPFSDARYDDFDPTVAPDGSFIIFTSTRPPLPTKTKSALLISYYRSGAWSVPQLYGGANPVYRAVEARLSPDLKTLYYSQKGALWERSL